MKIFIRSLIILSWLATGSLHVFGQQSNDINKIVAYGREKLLAVTEQNNKNDKSGISQQNQYILSLHTAEVLNNDASGNGDENFDREFIKQKSLTTSTGPGSYFINDGADLDKLNAQLQEQNRKSDIKAYLLFVDYVPMLYKRVLPAKVTMRDLLQNNSDKDSVIAKQALDIAASIIDAITQPFIDAQKGTQLLYCGFLKFKVYENSNVSRRNFNVYYPRNNVTNGEAGNVYQTILSNYIQSVKYNSAHKVGYVSNVIKALGNNNADYKTLLALINDGSFLQITAADKMEAVLKTVDANAFSGLPANYRIHALKVLSAASIPDSKEVLIDQLLETVRNGNDADEVISAMGKTNDIVPIVASQSVQEISKKDKCLLECIVGETDDNKIVDFWHGDNYKRLMNAFSALCKLSPSFKAQTIDLNTPGNDKLADRTIFYNYNSVWDKIDRTVFEVSSIPITGPLKEKTIDFDQCQLTTKNKLFYSYFYWKKTDPATLKPFEPIVFVNNSDLGMLSDFGKSTDEKEWIVPAIMLKFADDKAFNQSVTDGSMAVIDAASMATGYGEIKAGITSMRKAWALFDVVNGGVNLGLNVTNTPAGKEILTYYNLVTGGVSITRMAAGGVKNVYTFIQGKQALQSDAITGLLKAIKNGDLSAFSKDDIVNIEGLVQRIKKEAEARGLSGLKEDADDALAVLNGAAKSTEIWLAKYPNIRLFLGDGRVKGYLNSERLNTFTNTISTANSDVLGYINRMDIYDFEEMVSGYKDLLDADKSETFKKAISSTDAFYGERGWLKYWQNTPEIKTSLKTIDNLKTGNKLLSTGRATDIQLASIQAYTVSGDFINVPMRYPNSAGFMGDYAATTMKNMKAGLDKLRKVPERVIVNERVYSGKAFSKADFENKFVGGTGKMQSYPSFISTSQQQSVAEGFIDLTQKWAGDGEKVAVIQRIVSKDGVYIDDISDWGESLGNIRHNDQPAAVQRQYEVLLNPSKLKQIGEPVPIVKNGVQKTIKGMKAYYVDFTQ